MRLTIYDVAGKIVRTMELGHLTAGSYIQTEKAIYWDGKTETGEQVGSGTYFYQLKAGDYTNYKNDWRKYEVGNWLDVVGIGGVR